MFYNNPDDDDDVRSRVYDERKIVEKDNLQARDGQGPRNVRYVSNCATEADGESIS